MSSTAKWWNESRRGRLVGHGLAWRPKWRHIIAVTENGPAAVDIRALCGGIQSWSFVDSGLDLDDQQACENFHHLFVRSDERIVRMATCPKCIERLAAQRTKAVAS